MGEAGHFCLRRFELRVGPLKGARPGAKQRMSNRRLHRRVPIIESGAGAGRTGGKISMEANRKKPQAHQQYHAHRRQLEPCWPFQPE